MTTINSLQDILDALDNNPAWREAVRARILGEELMRLPAAFARFVQEQQAWNEEQKAWNEEQRAWNRRAEERFDAIDRRFDNIERRLDRMEDDNRYFKNKYNESETREKAAILADRLDLRFIRTLSAVELIAMAPDSLPRNVRDSFINTDMVIEAADAQDTTYIAVEVSYTGATRDLDRAIRNAEIISGVTGKPARAVVASVRNDHEVQDAIDSGRVVWFQMED